MNRLTNNINPEVIDIVDTIGIDNVDYPITIIQSSTAGDCNITANPQIIAGTAGQHLYLIGNDNTKTVTLNHNNGLSLTDGLSFTLGLNGIISLIYVNGLWIEKSRSDKPE
jgi:hypothetical protein